MGGFDALGAALQSINASVELVKALSSASGAVERAELKLKLANIMTDLAEAKLALAEGLEERNRLDAQIAELVEALRLKETVVRKFDAYYAVADDGPTGDPYCSRCWEATNRLYHLISAQRGDTFSSCAVCHSKYPKRTTPFSIERLSASQSPETAG